MLDLFFAVLGCSWLWLWLPTSTLSPLLQAIVYFGTCVGFVALRAECKGLLEDTV